MAATILAALLLCVAVALVALQSSAVSTWTLRSLAPRFLPDGVMLAIGRADGSWLRSLTLENVVVRRPDGDTAISIDRLHARYRLWPLLGRVFAIDSITIDGPVVRLERGPDPGWTLLPSAGGPDTAGGNPWTTRIGAVRVRNGRFDAEVNEDTVYRVSDLAVRASEIEVGTAFRGRLTGADATLQWGADQTAQGRLRIEGVRFDEARLQLDTLIIGTASSEIGGGGVVLWDESSPEGTRFRLAATPLAYRDLRPFVPAAGPGNARVRLEVRGGGGGYAFDARIETDDGGSIQLDGQYRPAGEGPLSVIVTGELDGIDLARMLANPALAGSISGSIAIDLTGTGPADLSGTARVAIVDSRVGGTALERIAVESRLERGVGDIALRADVAGVEVEGSGTVDVSGTRARYTWSGDVRYADPEVGRATGRLTLDGTGASSEGRLDVTLDVDSATFGAARVAGGGLSIRLDGGEVEGRFRLAAAGGRLEGRLGGSISAGVPEWRLEEGRLRHIDLGQLTGGGPRTDLNAMVTGRLLPATPPIVELAIRVDSSYVGRETVVGDLRLRYADDRADLEADLETGTGRVTLDMAAWPAEEPLRYAVTEARFEDLDLGALSARDLVTALSGNLTWTGAGTDPATLRSEVTLTLDASTINQARVDGGTVRLQAEGGRYLGKADLALETGGVDATARLTWAERPRWQARGSIDLPSLGAMLGDTVAASVAGRFDVAGDGLALADADGRGWVEIDEAAWRTLRADSARVALRVRDGGVAVDTLWVRSNLATVDGSGFLPLDASVATDTADLHIVADLESLAPIEALTGTAVSADRGRAEVQLTGPADSLHITGAAHVGALLSGSTTLVGLDVTTDARWSMAGGILSGELELLLDRLTLPTASVTRTKLTAVREGEAIRIGAEARVDARRTAELDALLEPGDRPLLTVERLVFQVDEDRWTLPAPARIRYGGGIEIEDLVLEASGQRIALDAVRNESGITSLRASVDSLRVETVADLLGFDRLAGTLSARVDLDGVGDARTGDAELDFAFRSDESGGGVVRATADVSGQRIAFDADVLQDGRRNLHLEGDAPLGVESSAVFDVRVHADSLRIDLLTPLLDPGTVQGLGGRIDGDVRITGSLDEPRPEGTLRFADVRAHLPALGVTYRLEGATTMSAGGVRLDGVRVEGGDGDMTLEGEIRLEGGGIGRYDVVARLDNFRAVDNDLVHAVLHGELDVRGTLAEPGLTGEVTIERGDLFLDQGIATADVEEVVLTDDDYAELEDHFGFPIGRRTESATPGFEALALDLNVRVGRDSWLRQGASPELAVQVTGEFSVQKEPGPELRLLGELEAVPRGSYMEQFGRRFRLREGLLVFRGDPLDTRIVLDATYEVPSRSDDEPEAVIILGLEGEVGELRVILGSEPEMENADIVSYIATGRPLARSFQAGDGGEGGVMSRAGDLALARVTSLVEGFAAERVGLDVVEIRREGLEAATLIAGRYVSPVLYLGFQQPLGVEQEDAESNSYETRIEVELQAYRWLLLNLQSGGEALQFFLRTRYGY